VWIGRETLERNAINTACSEALMPEADFNGNHSRAESTSGSDSGARGASNRSSGVSGPGAEGGGGGASNRNSYVSTYKGSECSVHITGAGAAGGAVTNPAPLIPDCNANHLDDRSSHGASATNHVNDRLGHCGDGPGSTVDRPPRSSEERFGDVGSALIGHSLSRGGARQRLGSSGGHGGASTKVCAWELEPFPGLAS